MRTDTPRTILLSDYKPSPYLIETVDLDISLEPRKTVVTAKLRLRANPASSEKGAALVLDGEHLKLERVKLAGRLLTRQDYKLSKESLTIPKPPARPFTLEITTTCDPHANKALSGLYRSSDIYCTQCEAQGFRRITYFIDRPDILSVYTVRLEADAKSAPILLANGNPVKSGKLAGGRHFAVWHDPHPKPAYLFAIVGGELGLITDKITTMSGREAELRIYVEPGKEQRAHWAMDSLKRSMKWDEKRFGREYDLDLFMIVAVSDFNMGAMENKGLNIFNDKLILADPETATDADYQRIESVVAHEYFHNWSGNRVTCRDWFQLCLKEGFTVFRDQEFSSDERSRTVQRIADVKLLKSHQFPEDAGPLAHPVRPESYMEINNFYTATVYEKGAELCRMILSMVGPKGFRKGSDLYFERHDGEAATVEDFIRAFEDANKIDLSQFMLWYRQSGTPELICSFAYDARSRSAELTLSQVLPATPGQTNKKPQQIPVRLGLVGADGKDLPLKLADGAEISNGMVLLSGHDKSFRFVDLPQRPVPSLLRGFSAPVNLTIELSDADLEFLMRMDGDLFNRWQAAQTYATRLIVSQVEAIRAGKKPRGGAKFARALADTLADDSLEPAYRALFLQIPSESDLAREMRKDVDPEAIHLARQQLLQLIGRELGDQLATVYEQTRITGKFKPDARSSGRRALRNTALALLAHRAGPADLARAVQHFETAQNMTDQTAALAILTDREGPQRDAVFESFFERWKDDALVLDKWFTMQAISSRPDVLDVVEGLTRHKLFSLKNPNRVRALVGAFATANPLHFNRPDGAGYRFLADRVIEIDGFNPQIAARLLGAFRSWRSLEAKRRNAARKVLKLILAESKLSRDSFEIASKILD